MLGRLALAGAILVAGISSGYAAPIIPLLQAAQACAHLAKTSQCTVQVMVDGTNDTAYSYVAQQGTGVQIGLTYQEGQNNVAFTGLLGTDQASLTAQTGNNNGGFTYQNGSHQISTTVETGNGGWSATSSVGSHTVTSVGLSSF
jgi:hypothetical protein